MRCLLALSIFVLALSLNSFQINAGELSYTPPEGEKIERQPMEDTLNYFSNKKKQLEEMEIEAKTEEQKQEEIIVDGIPQNELKNLPDTINMEGRAELKMHDGELVAKTSAQDNDINCDNVPTDEQGNKTGECAQKLGTEAALKKETPKTLDQQLEEKENGNSNNIAETAIVDKKRGSKTNIISNTDTGVKLVE